MTGREALLGAFDRLFDAAATKLQVACTDEERADARADFARRFEHALEIAAGIDVSALPDEVLDAMMGAIRNVSGAQLAGVLASIPLAQQTQDLVRAVLVRQAEQRLLAHMAMQADTSYGGN